MSDSLPTDAPPPLPAQSLEYATPTHGRPGVITAIGVISICVAALSFLSNIGTGFQAVMIYTIPRRVSTMTATSGSATPPAVSSIIPGSPATTNPFPASGYSYSPVMTAAEMQAIIARVQALSGKTLTPPQAVGLRRVLALSSRVGITPTGSAASTAAQVTFAASLPRGEVMISTNAGSFTLNSRGQVSGTSGGVTLASGSAGLHITPVSTWILSALITVILADMALDIYLLVIAILTLQQSPRGRRLHHIYAIIKIPLVLLGEVAYGMLISAFINGMMGGIAPTALPAIMMAIFMVMLGLIYPVALLITLRSRGVRAYYALAQAGEKSSA